jgi:hypothetical protein
MAMPPQSYCIVAGASKFLHHWFLLVIISFPLLLWFDLKIFRYLHKTKGRRAGRIWELCVAGALILVLAWSVWALFTPLLFMGQIVVSK